MVWNVIERNSNYQALITQNEWNRSYLYDPYFILGCVPTPAFTWTVTEYVDNPLNLYYAGVSFS